MSRLHHDGLDGLTEAQIITKIKEHASRLPYGASASVWEMRPETTMLDCWGMIDDIKQLVMKFHGDVPIDLFAMWVDEMYLENFQMQEHDITDSRASASELRANSPYRRTRRDEIPVEELSEHEKVVVELSEETNEVLMERMGECVRLEFVPREVTEIPAFEAYKIDGRGQIFLSRMVIFPFGDEGSLFIIAVKSNKEIDWVETEKNYIRNFARGNFIRLNPFGV